MPLSKSSPGKLAIIVQFPAKPGVNELLKGTVVPIPLGLMYVMVNLLVSKPPGIGGLG